jgi:PIN domain nuclease of toxin-antitoxin system
VLDASALLAYRGDEPGAEVVADAAAVGATLPTVNLAEAPQRSEPRTPGSSSPSRAPRNYSAVLSPSSPSPVSTRSRRRGFARPTRSAGLSLGYRAYLALATRLRAAVLTADCGWSPLQLRIEIHVIR